MNTLAPPKRAVVVSADPSQESVQQVRALLAEAGIAVVDATVLAGEGLVAAPVVFVHAAHPLFDEGAARVRQLAVPPPTITVAFGGPGERVHALASGFDAFVSVPPGPEAAAYVGLIVRSAVTGDRLLEAERQVQQLHGRADRLTGEVRERVEFLQSLSHELATPLTPLMGYLKMLRSGRLGPLTDKQTQAIEAMANAARRLEECLDNLGDYTALQSGRERIHVEDVDAALLVDECVRDHHALARSRHVLLDARHPKTAPMRADGRKVRQALSHVVDNAVRFSPHGGHVLVQLVDGPDRMHFVVYDQGPGVPADADLGALARRDDRTASGLGLPVTRQIVEAHHGGLVLESPPREQPDARELFTGSKVGFWLPKTQAIP